MPKMREALLRAAKNGERSEEARLSKAATTTAAVTAAAADSDATGAEAAEGAGEREGKKGKPEPKDTRTFMQKMKKWGGEWGARFGLDEGDMKEWDQEIKDGAITEEELNRELIDAYGEGFLPKSTKKAKGSESQAGSDATSPIGKKVVMDDEGHVMEWSDFNGGAYGGGGWSCDQCGKSGGKRSGNAFRFNCKKCLSDYCKRCGTKKAVDAPAGGGADGGPSRVVEKFTAPKDANKKFVAQMKKGFHVESVDHQADEKSKVVAKVDDDVQYLCIQKVAAVPMCRNGHPMTGPKPLDDHWCCSMAPKLGGSGCKSGFTDFDQANGNEGYGCEVCDFDLCVPCAAASTGGQLAAREGGGGGSSSQSEEETMVGLTDIKDVRAEDARGVRIVSVTEADICIETRNTKGRDMLVKNLRSFLQLKEVAHGAGADGQQGGGMSFDYSTNSWTMAWLEQKSFDELVALEPFALAADAQYTRPKVVGRMLSDGHVMQWELCRPPPRAPVLSLEEEKEDGAADGAETGAGSTAAAVAKPKKGEKGSEKDAKDEEGGEKDKTNGEGDASKSKSNQNEGENEQEKKDDDDEDDVAAALMFDENAPAELKTGMNVEARSPKFGLKEWYPGVLGEVNEQDGTCTVKFEDGQSESGIKRYRVRAVGEVEREQTDPLSVGDCVDAYFAGGTKLHAGLVTAVHEDITGAFCTYDIKYDDGEEEADLGQDFIVGQCVPSLDELVIDWQDEEDDGAAPHHHTASVGSGGGQDVERERQWTGPIGLGGQIAGPGAGGESKQLRLSIYGGMRRYERTSAKLCAQPDFVLLCSVGSSGSSGEDAPAQQQQQHQESLICTTLDQLQQLSGLVGSGTKFVAAEDGSGDNSGSLATISQEGMHKLQVKLGKIAQKMSKADPSVLTQCLELLGLGSVTTTAAATVATAASSPSPSPSPLAPFVQGGGRDHTTEDAPARRRPAHPDAPQPGAPQGRDPRPDGRARAGAGGGGGGAAVRVLRPGRAQEEHERGWQRTRLFWSQQRHRRHTRSHAGGPARSCQVWSCGDSECGGCEHDRAGGQRHQRRGPGPGPRGHSSGPTQA